MADEVQNTAAAPAVAPTPSGKAVESTAEREAREGRAGIVQPQGGSPPAGLQPVQGADTKVKAPARSNLITNPAPVVDPDARPVEEPPKDLPESTLREMEAGKKALERNSPPRKS